MIETVREMLWQEFGAAIDMLEETIRNCPDELWDDRTEGIPFWHMAYHTLFYLDLYLSESEEAFTAAEFHTENAQFLRDMPFPPHKVDTPEKAHTREQLLGYLQKGRRKCREVTLGMTEERLASPSPFWWVKVSVGGLVLYNMRHVQHHAAQLSLLLRRKKDIGTNWISKTAG